MTGKQSSIDIMHMYPYKEEANHPLSLATLFSNTKSYCMSMGDVLNWSLSREHKLSSSLHCDLISRSGANRNGTSRYTGFICRTTADIFRSTGAASGGGGAGRTGTVPKAGTSIVLSPWERRWEFSDFCRPSWLYSDFDCPSPILRTLWSPKGCCKKRGK